MEKPGRYFGSTWVQRAGLRRRRRAPGEPLPPEMQTGFPADYFAHLPDAGNIPAAQVVLDVGRFIGARKPQKFDGDDSNPVLSSLHRIMARLGTHGQILTNFRAIVGVADVVVLPFNPMRAYLFMVNTGALEIRVSFDRGADAVSGIPIPSGGFFEPILGTVSSVHAVSTAAAQSLVISEGFYHWGASGG